jgi:hypothetical protein
MEQNKSEEVEEVYDDGEENPYKDMQLRWIEISTASIKRKYDHSLLILDRPIIEDGFVQVYTNGTWKNQWKHSLRGYYNKCKSCFPLSKAVMPIFQQEQRGVFFPFTEPFSPTITLGVPPSKPKDCPLFVPSYHDAIAYLSVKYEKSKDGLPSHLRSVISRDWPSDCVKTLCMHQNAWIRGTWENEGRLYGLKLTTERVLTRAGQTDEDQLAIHPACWVENGGIEWDHC